MSLADRHRPSDFSEVVGQEEVVRSISKLLMQDEHPRTYLFHGPAGCGKTSIARIIKKKLECADAEYNEMNVANTRGIDTVRDVIQKAKFSPFFGKIRIFLFDECHRLTADSQHALLKILE